VLLENEHVADAGVVGIKLYFFLLSPFHTITNISHSGEEELPRAYVVIQAASKDKVSPEDIEHWIKSQVAKYKYLVGGVVFVREVPKLASGKIQRRVLREWAKKDAELMQRRPQSRL
jgi:acyl-coenzyme A synthetase/AMP-(fatty) acid ligase